MALWKKGVIRHRGEIIAMHWGWKDYMVIKDPYPHSYHLILMNFGPSEETKHLHWSKQCLHPDADLGKYAGLREACKAGEEHYNKQHGEEVNVMEWIYTKLGDIKGWKCASYIITKTKGNKYELGHNDDFLASYTRLSTAKRGAMRDVSRQVNNDLAQLDTQAA
jgi:hypothetical protein